MKKKIQRLQVILKNAERCNIACKYCYYFFGGDESYKDRPPLISRDVVLQTAEFLRNALDDLDIKSLQIVFHGGEPLMQKKADFDWCCGIFQEYLSGKTQLQFSVQTNGMLINDEWLEVFTKYEVHTGVSIDGDEYYNDLYRIDKKGKGTYQKVVAGLNKLQENAKSNNQAQPGALTVVNSSFSYKRIINHFVNELNLSNIGILLPDMTHDDEFPKGRSAVDYGKALVDIFEEWKENPDVQIRPIKETVDFFQVEKKCKKQQALNEKIETFIAEGGHFVKNQIIVIQSDGEITLDDSFMLAHEWRNSVPKSHVSTISLKKYLEMEVFDEIKEYYEDLPEKCQSCTWVKLCKGGDLENRYKKDNGFAQESVFCDGLQIYYEHVVKYLYESGYPKEQLERKLFG